MNRTDQEDARVRLACLLLGLVTILAYLPVQFYDYAYYDDVNYVTQNAAVQAGLNWAGVRWAFASFDASNWHPITWLSHMLDWTLFGSNPGAQHLVNALFHAANAMLFFVLWHRTTRRLWPCAIAAAVFAWHPLRVQSVAWIAERKDVLSTFFGLLALLSYVKYATSRRVSGPSSVVSGGRAEGGRRKAEGRGEPVKNRPASDFRLPASASYVWALIWFALGLMAKPMLVTWPFVLLLLDFWPLRRFEGPQVPGRHFKPLWRRCRALVLEKWPFFAMVLPVCVLTVLAQKKEALASLQTVPMDIRLANTLVSYARYLLKTVWPSGLTISYPFSRHYPAWQLAGATILLLGVSGWVWRRRRQEPFWVTGWLWYLGTLVPVIGLVQVGAESMADRYTYIPMMGLVVAVSFGAANALDRLQVRRVYVTAACSLLLGALLAQTQQQLSYWQNPVVLLRHAIALNPRNRIPHQILGSYLCNQGMVTNGLDELLVAVNILDSDIATSAEKGFSARAHQALAHDYAQHGMRSKALEQFDAALRLAPESAEAHNDLANLLSDMGREPEALWHYREAIRLQPNSPQPHENLGTFLAEAGKYDESIRELSEAARLAPGDALPHRLMGMAYLRQGNRNEAAQQFRLALTLDASDVRSAAYLQQIAKDSTNSPPGSGKVVPGAPPPADSSSSGPGR